MIGFNFREGRFIVEPSIGECKPTFPVRMIVSGEGDIGERVAAVHDYIKRLPGCGRISRVAIAVYDNDTDLISTSAYSDDNDVKFSLYSARLSDVASLKEIAMGGDPRIVDDVRLSYASQGGLCR